MTTPRVVAFAHLNTALRAYFEAVWDEALVPLGGASRDWDNRSSFLHAHLEDEYPCTEYRFQGHLGFGGKVRTAHDLKCRVDYYPEEHTELRAQQMVAINVKLSELWEQYFASRMAPRG